MAKKNSRLTLVLFLMLSSVLTGYALDFTIFPTPIQKGSTMVSVGGGAGWFAPGLIVARHSTHAATSSTWLEGTVAFDYALPFNFALTIGGEIGLSGAAIKAGRWEEMSDIKLSLLEIPIIARIAWHPNWGVKNLDTYVLLKFGYGIGFWSGADAGEMNNPHGIIYGSNIGCRYFIRQSLGVFIEVGSEIHLLEDSFAFKFVTAGVSFLLGGKSTEE
jgi:hypothetical protein